MEWNSLHLFIHDLTYHNNFLITKLKPLIEILKQKDLLEKYFFIIYWKGGNHIRFRFKSKNPEIVEEKLKECFNQYLMTYEPKHVMSEKVYLDTYKKNKENVIDLEMIKDGNIKKFKYEPEYDRYGGKEAIEYSENIFECSSEYALKIREITAGNFNQRIIIALDLFAVAISNLSNKGKFLTYYKKYWEDFSENVKYNIISEDKLFDFYFNRYQKIISNTPEFYNDWKESININLSKAISVNNVFENKELANIMLLASHIHMNNNRLSIMPQLESILANVLLRCERM